MKLTTIIALLAANFMVANAASTMNQIVIDLSNSDDSPSFHDDADIPDGPGSLDTDNLANSYDVDSLSDNFPSFPNGLTNEPSCYETVEGDINALLPRIYYSKCLLMGFRSGSERGTYDYKYNCCGRSSWVRSNLNDWVRLRKAGKLDGVRFSTTFVKDRRRYFNYFKIVNNERISITSQEYFQ